MNGITVQKSKIREEKGVVILPVEEYRKLLMRSVPTLHFHGKEAGKLDKLVGDGFKELKRGKTKKIKSLAELE